MTPWMKQGKEVRVTEELAGMHTAYFASDKVSVTFGKLEQTDVK